ncbi:deaminase [Actinomadura sp. GC306]|uniref:dihydrofolate reductase family protein n=1 Tax=Actinomadura sp. GC306 TaxID=2530367 RepID=UPI00104A115B|nr:dihydrofolate reductase family protein [Actinomadura sp. GC306]TDC60362.1 deaminase [Actinomadura sp. GC306]
MGTVVYGMHASMDGFIEGPDGGFGFTEPAADVHQAANDQVRRCGAFLFGRRLYEVMEKPWTEQLGNEGAPAVEREFARLYRGIPRYVFSDTLQSVPDGVTLVRRKDAVSVVERLKREVDGNLEIGGAELAASLVDLIDEFLVYEFPVLVGGGRTYLPVDGEVRLRLVELRSFESGVLFKRFVRA